MNEAEFLVLRKVVGAAEMRLLLSGLLHVNSLPTLLIACYDGAELGSIAID